MIVLLIGWSLWKNTDIVVISIFRGNKSRSNYIIIVEILMLPIGLDTSWRQGL